MIPARWTTDVDTTALKRAAREVFPEGVSLRTSRTPQVIFTGLSQFEDMVRQFQHVAECVPWPGHDAETLYLDIETHNAEKRWDMPLEKFFRLGQYAWGINGEVHVTTDLEEVLALCRSAYGVVAHNGHAFDFSVLLGDDALTMNLFDTMIHANMVFPAPYSYTDRSGHTYYDAAKPGRAMKWLSLDNLCFQLGTDGKVADLKDLAIAANPKGTPRKDLDFGLIPLDDPLFLRYAKQDVVALQGVTRALMGLRAMNEYDWREQKIAAINAQFTRNGVPVDVAKAQERVDALAAKKADLMRFLVDEYGFPSEGTMPWRTSEGKAAIFKILSDNGITPQTRPDWPLTATGNPSLSGDAIVELTEGTLVQDLGEALAQLQGQRSLAQLTLDCVHSDGMVHPEITSLQRSGRFSVTKPGLTVFGARGGRDVDKEYFVAGPGHKMLEYDYSAADARAVAAMSGDPEFAKRFKDGVDPHDISGTIFFGADDYYQNRDVLRPLAKAATHALGYRVGAGKLSSVLNRQAKSSGREFTVADAAGFIENYQRAYPLVHAWQEAATDLGDKGFIYNKWGRRMPVDPDRSFTQSSALLGQSFTREILCDGLLEMLDRDPRLLKWIRFSVHDAVVAIVPEDEVEYAQTAIKEALSTEHGGIHFPVAHGPAADNWREAGH